MADTHSTLAPGVTLLFTPGPTPNGPLHVGHLSGPYIAGDIAARAARAAGRNVLTMSGLDSYQNYVVARAAKERLSPSDTVAKFAEPIRSALEAARIGYDLFLDPLADGDYRDGIARLLDELVERKAVAVEQTTQSTCEGCGRLLHHVWVRGQCPECGQDASGGTCEGCSSFLTAGDLVDALSTCCQASRRAKRIDVPVLRMEAYRERLTEIWSRAVFPPRVRTLLARYLDRGLPDVPLAYVTDWGIPWLHEGVEYRVDVWVEMVLSNLFAVPRHLTGRSPQNIGECIDGWAGVDQVWYFTGIDNVFYLSALFPALLVAAGMPAGKFAGLITNEFYRLDGSKFSTSRNHAIWAHEFLADEDPATVRAYLAWDRPDRSSTNFTMDAYEAFREMFERARRDGGRASMPSVLASQDLDRAVRALDFDAFDPALAVRCVLGVSANADERAAAVWRSITGE